MYDIIPFIFILASLASIITIVARKFSLLAALDVDTIQSEKEARFKEQILSSKLKRNIFFWWSKISHFLVPVGTGIRSFFQWLYRKIVDLKAAYSKPVASFSTPTEIAAQKEQLLWDAEEAYKKDDHAGAEQKLIELISMDPKNIPAFSLLAKVYFTRKDYNESKQTYEHILKMTEGSDPEKNEMAGCHFDLAEVNLVMDNIEAALENINEALRSEPNNPRYLDSKCKISIIRKDKIMALEALDKMKEVNPENQKIIEYSRQISEL